MATCFSAQERLRKEGAKMAEPTSIFSEAAAQAASTHMRSSTAASPEARPSSAQMPSRPAISAVWARRAISGSAMPAGKGFEITTPMLTIEVLFDRGAAHASLQQPEVAGYWQHRIGHTGAQARRANSTTTFSSGSFYSLIAAVIPRASHSTVTGCSGRPCRAPRPGQSSTRHPPETSKKAMLITPAFPPQK